MSNEELNAQEQAESYTNLSGELVTVESMDWLEDGFYWSDAADERFDDEEDDQEPEPDQYPCSRYQVGIDASGEGISVWLNENMVEVEV